MKIQLPEKTLKDLKLLEDGYKKMANINLEFARWCFYCENDACKAYEQKLKELNAYGS